MTALDSLPLAQELMAMVETATGFPQYLAGAPRDVTDAKYNVWYPDTGIKSGLIRNLANDGPDELRYQVTSVGVGPEQAMWAADATSASLAVGVPSVSGRRVWKTVQEGSQPVRRDDTSTGLWYATNQYLTRSDPA
jgi:hypothetical protein